MNERILELAEESDISIRYYYDQSGSTLKELEKFARLIVRECMRMCDVAANGYDTPGLVKEANGCASAKEYIADWFEVEEYFGVNNEGN